MNSPLAHFLCAYYRACVSSRLLQSLNLTDAAQDYQKLLYEWQTAWIGMRRRVTRRRIPIQAVCIPLYWRDQILTTFRVNVLYKVQFIYKLLKCGKIVLRIKISDIVFAIQWRHFVHDGLENVQKIFAFLNCAKCFGWCDISHLLIIILIINFDETNIW